MTTRVIAFYLPQYHEIKENNEWWGKGFTEWTNVANAKMLYKGHYQPKIPYKNNYYCLLESKVQEWQSEIAIKSGIYGFCYYHYWFNGKLLIEKPMENMLTNKNIRINFCISWANEPWTRTWTGKDKDVLMPQRYGDKEEWECHLQYLLPFFKDERYILKENKPVMLIYRAENVLKCREMIEYWNKRLKEFGFAGIYVLETLTGWQKKKKIENSAGVVAMEPMHCMADGVSVICKLQHKLIRKLKLQRFGILDEYNYDYIWKKILNKNFSQYSNFYYGGFMNWDNTARKGEKAILLRGFTIRKFKYYISRIYEKSVDEKKEYLFFNAWNEWSEGTYLEPDSMYGYGYLKVIREMIKKNGGKKNEK